MKIFVLLACVAGALSFSIDDVDLNNLVPVHETAEWKAAFPSMADRLEAHKEHIPQYKQRNGRIWGGRDAALGELPYQVGILILTSQQSFCGGSIVSANFVLSAAQCFPGDPNAIVEIGNPDRNFVTEFINAAEKIVHENFDGAISDNDIALVRLVRPIVLGPNQAIVRLPNRRQVDQTFENQQGRISGWGTTGTGVSAPIRNLRVGFAQVISQAACRIRFPNSSSTNTICIDGISTNICGGDFGGPLVITDADAITTQIGVASFNAILGCTAGWPGGFTRVSRYLEWISERSGGDVVIRDNF